MAMTLELTKDGRVLDRFQFDAEAVVVVGRGEDCDVRIDNLSVSRRHCEILRKDSFHLISDQGSSNGTFVNGRRVRESPLTSGDVITVGEFTLNYTGNFGSLDQPQIPLAAHGVPEMTIQLNPAKPAPAAVLAGRRPTSKLRGHLTLADQQNVLLQKTTFLIGSGVEADLQAPARRTPRLSALILRERFCFRLLDVSPKGNQVAVNGNPTRNVELENGMEVVVSGLRFRFYKGLPTLEDTSAMKRMHAQTRRVGRIPPPPR